jgi:hypothetical protein
MRLLAAALACALIGGGASAKDTEGCIAAAGAVSPDFAMPHVAAAIARKRLDVVVIGSASSELTGSSGSNIAYPTRLAVALGNLLPGVAVKVTTYAQARETAGEMERKLSRIAAQSKPALVVWQTGTADAIRGVDPDDFRLALEGRSGFAPGGRRRHRIHEHAIQPTHRNHAGGGRLWRCDAHDCTAARNRAFDRLAIMKRWNEAGVFDLYAATRKTDVAEQVHDCLGRLLAKVVVEQGNESRLTRLWLQGAENVQQVLRVPGGALAAALD